MTATSLPAQLSDPAREFAAREQLEDVDRAVAAARRAFEEEPWSRISAADRGRVLARLADLVERHAEELAQLESLDNGKPVKLAKIVDVASTVAWLRHFAGWPERVFGGTIPVRQPDMLFYTRKEPVDVCRQISSRRISSSGC